MVWLLLVQLGLGLRGHRMGLIYRQESDLILGEGQCRVLMHSYNSAGPVAIHLYRKASTGDGRLKGELA